MQSPDDNNVEENTTNQLVTPESSTCSTVCDEFPYILESSKQILSIETSSERDNHYSTASSFEESTISCPSTIEGNFEVSGINCLGTKEDIFAPWVSIFEELGSDFWTEPFVAEAAYTANEMCSSKDMAFLTPEYYDGTNVF